MGERRGHLIAPSYPLREFSLCISYLISNEKFVLYGESGWICGTEPPRWPEDGVPQPKPFLAVFYDEWHNEVPVPLYALPGKIQDLRGRKEKKPMTRPSSNKQQSKMKYKIKINIYIPLGRENTELRCPGRVMAANKAETGLIEWLYSHLDVEAGFRGWQVIPPGVLTSLTTATNAFAAFLI